MDTFKVHTLPSMCQYYKPECVVYACSKGTMTLCMCARAAKGVPWDMCSRADVLWCSCLWVSGGQWLEEIAVLLHGEAWCSDGMVWRGVAWGGVWAGAGMGAENWQNSYTDDLLKCSCAIAQPGATLGILLCDASCKPDKGATSKAATNERCAMAKQMPGNGECLVALAVLAVHRRSAKNNIYNAVISEEVGDRGKGRWGSKAGGMLTSEPHVDRSGAYRVLQLAK